MSDEYYCVGGRSDEGGMVIAICSGSDEHHEAKIILDKTVQNYPWRHWHIIFSTSGGTVAEPWCP